MQPSSNFKSVEQANATHPRINEESFPRRNSRDLLEVWLRSVHRVAEVGSAENFSSLKDLASTIPATQVELMEVQEVITRVQATARTHVYDPLLREKAQNALSALSRV